MGFFVYSLSQIVGKFYVNCVWDEKALFIIAYNQIQEKEDVMDDEQKEKFLNYPIPKKIIQEWERVS